MLEPATLETTSQMQTHESKPKRRGRCYLFFDNVKIILEKSYGKVLKGKIGFCGLKECVMIWLNLNHFYSSFLVFGSIICLRNLHSETTGKVVRLIICCAVWSVQQTINKQSIVIVVCLRDKR